MCEVGPERSSRNHLAGHLYVGDQVVPGLLDQPEAIIEFDELCPDDGTVGGARIGNPRGPDFLHTPRDVRIVWVRKLAHGDLGELVSEVLGDAIGGVTRKD